MFIILRGSINIRMEKMTSIGIMENTVTSMYDGADFGSLSIMGAILKNKRMIMMKKKLDKISKASSLMNSERIIQEKAQIGEIEVE